MPKMRLVTFIFFALGMLESFGATPEWVWHDNQGARATNNEVRYFRKSFQLKSAPQKAVVSVVGDDHATVFVNGKQMAVSPSWSEPATITVTTLLKAGENILAARGRNSSGDAALLVRLEITNS